MTDSKEQFRREVWWELRNDAPEVYRLAQEQEDAVNALIDKGNEAGWDSESVAEFIKQSVK